MQLNQSLKHVAVFGMTHACLWCASQYATEGIASPTLAAYLVHALYHCLLLFASLASLAMHLMGFVSLINAE